MATAILNNYGILESIVSFLDCKSMVQLSLACKQLSSDVNKNALSILKPETVFAHQYEVITVVEENDHRIKLTISETEFVQPYTTTVFGELNELRTRNRLKKLLETLVIESLEDDDIEHTSVDVEINAVGPNSFYVDVQIISDNAADMGDNPSEQLDYIAYSIIKELGGGLIKSITGRVRTTDEVKQDEAMSRRIKEGFVKENQHNL